MDKSCTKILLFDTALELFRKFGYDTVSVSRICSESGLTRNAFYYYFPSKDALLSSFVTIQSPTTNNRHSLQGRLYCKEGTYAMLEGCACV